MNTEVAAPSLARLFTWLEPRPAILLMVLIGVTLGLRAAQLAQTSVTTRDSIGFIRFAWHLEQRRLVETLRSHPHHPLYPMAIWAASKLFRPLTPTDLPRAMERSCLAVNVVVSVLVAVALFYLGRELFSVAVGFFGSLLFQLLPASGRLLGDGLSEPLLYLFASLCLLAASRGLRQAVAGKPCVGLLALSGALAGLAYLTRPEGLLLAALTALLAFLYVRTWRAPAAVMVGLLIVAGPYMVTIGGLTVKPSAAYFVDPDKWKREEPGRAMRVQPTPLAAWE
ncbi:MAG: glycosyltransferase family 39 protein, partial [Gemmataceae bacterium]